MKKIVFIGFVLVLILLGVYMYIMNFRRDGASTESHLQGKQNSISQSPISIDYLRSKTIVGSKITIDEELSPGSNYKRYIAHYLSEENKVFGLLTVPIDEPPSGGFPAIVFNHGYIPPKQYVTTDRYVSYVDSLARNGFVVFKIDFRGNGNSEGDASGSYFSSAYTIDTISALKSLQTFNKVNPNRIGMWGHSMAGNVVLRAMEVSPDIKAGVIWAGAVYSYSDFAKYGISDSSYIHRPFEQKNGPQQADREVSSEIQKIRSAPKTIDFSSNFWKSISLTQNLNYLKAPLEIHQAINDPTVNIGYSRDLVVELKKQNKPYEYFEYEGGGHNIESPYFETAMERTIAFFKKSL